MNIPQFFKFVFGFALLLIGLGLLVFGSHDPDSTTMSINLVARMGLAVAGGYTFQSAL